MKQNNLGKKSGLYIIYFFISIFFLIPVLWVLSYSFKTIPELFATPLQILPKQLNLDNYMYVIKNTSIPRSIFNTFYIVVISIIGTIAIAIPASYIFSRFKFKGANSLQFIILMFRMISPIVIVIPLYVLLNNLNLANSHIIMIFIYIALSLPLAILNIKGYIDGIPKSVDEAALIDGASRAQIITKIHFHVALPGLISVALVTMVALWGQFIVPFILLSDAKKYPISTALNNMSSASEAITTHYLAAACILSILPTTILFIILQRFIVSSMTDGAVKG
ncbi:MAG: carbohydrate ABC transporter permease [Pleomorphochaeta sp.]